MLHGAATPDPPAGDGCRYLGVLEPADARAAKVIEARAEIARQLHVPIGEVDVVTTRASATHEVVQAQWLPAWQRG